MLKTVCVLLVGSALFFSSPGFSGPLNIHNSMPLYLFYVLPPPDKARPMAKGALNIGMSHHVSNIIVNQGERAIKGSKVVTWGALIDAEVNRFDFNLSYGLMKNLKVSTIIPYYIFTTGFLDGFIEGFEQFFAHLVLARQGRSRYNFEYRVWKNGKEIIEKGSPPEGLGDVSFYLTYKLFSEDQWRPFVSFRAGIKAPTAQHTLLGNKKFDYNVGLLFEKKLLSKFGMYLNLNVLSTSRPEIFNQFNFFKLALSGSLAFDYKATEKLDIILQLTGVSRVFDDGNKEMTVFMRNPFIYTLGIDYRITKKLSFEFALNEDTGSSAPDFGVFSALRLNM